MRLFGFERHHHPLRARAHGRREHRPDGLVGSITHTQGFASAAVADLAVMRSVGIDTEQRFTFERARRLDDHLAHPGEVAALVRAGGIDEDAAATLVFSAKESVFKCLHPFVRRFFGFHAARVVRADGGRFVARLTEGLTAEFVEGYELHGRYVVAGEHVHTAVALPWRRPGDGW